MSFVIELNEKIAAPSEWCEFEGYQFKIRSINHKAYQVAIELRDSVLRMQGFDLTKVTDQSQSINELFMKAVAHLIEDWKTFTVKNEKNEDVAFPFSYDNALRLLLSSSQSTEIWLFITTNAERIQDEYDKQKEEILGKSEPTTSGKAKTQRKSKTQSTKP